MSDFDVAIVGGGIIGGSIAFELAQQKLRVVLLDRQHPGREASWAAAGMLAPAPESSDSIPLVPLAQASLKLFPEFLAAVEDASGQRTGYRQDGTLVLFFPPEGERKREAMLALHRELGLPAEAVSLEEAQLWEPDLNPAATVVVRLPTEASVDNRALTQAVLAAAARCGAQVRTGALVTKLILAKNRCTGIIANGEEIHAGQVVIAAGCFSSVIEPIERYAPTRPVRGQMAALRSGKVHLGRVLRSEGGYLVPRNDGRLIAGSTLENAGFEKDLTPAGLLQVLSTAVRLVPALADATIVETWSGLRPDTPDHLPVLGPTDLEGLSIATGHFRDGILLAPITAKLAREWLTGQRTSLPLAQFSPLRFSEQKKEANR